MSVIFQLFCAEDLFRFNEDERKILRARIKEALAGC
jgi:hypothetical protein